MILNVTYTELKLFIQSGMEYYHSVNGNTAEVLIPNGQVVYRSLLKGADRSDYEANLASGSNKKHFNVNSPWASKSIGGKNLFKRIHGQISNCSIGWNDIYFTIPYNSCKITGAEFINCEFGDYCELYILDTATGTLSTIPNYPLNKFGYDVALNNEYYSYKSEYEADLIIGLQVYVRYYSISAKNVGLNYILNEVK